MRQNKYFLILKRTVEEQDTTAGRVFDWFIMGLILLSLLSFSLETLPNISESARDALKVVEKVTIAIFTTEYILRLFVADRKLKYVFSFYGIIDLVAIVPYYAGVNMVFIRTLRLLKLFRFSRAFHRYEIAVYSIRHELLLFFMIAGSLLFITAVGIYRFENAAQPEVYSSIFTSLWWAVVTLTTVGYGDMVPITHGGRIFTFFLLMVGLGVFAVPTGLLASALTKPSNGDDKEGKE